MPQDSPEVFNPPASLPDSVVYDIFAGTATRLGGEYVYLADRADNPEAEEQWKAKHLALSGEKRSVDPYDRVALVEHVNRWLAELDELLER